MNIQTNIATILFIIIPSLVGFSQEEKPTSSWTLKDCIDYARKNNIQVQSARVTPTKCSNVDLLQAKAQLFPSSHVQQLARLGTPEDRTKRTVNSSHRAHTRAVTP